MMWVNLPTECKWRGHTISLGGFTHIHMIMGSPCVLPSYPRKYGFYPQILSVAIRLNSCSDIASMLQITLTFFKMKWKTEIGLTLQS